MDADVPRVVLDTNVCLDLFVFDDPRLARLREALRAGTVVAVSDAACRSEWHRVLAYPALGLAPDQVAAAIDAFDALLQPAPETGAPATPGLPRCRDPDDQKFLDLASRCRARWLLSRDDHLLSLARRAARVGGFEILPPQAWCGRYAP